ncbi:Hypothetical predicted protein [Octopus vulgaris]|uniref:Uncharacterized protein n=1 Tax=Octopus vulgaris TaxID=6645 RepID=A0AA36B9J3_OCTVU|nr:Hypothetical predicted protein [Octopus vulgaris]
MNKNIFSAEKMSNGGLPSKENVVDSSTKLKIVEGSPDEKTKDAEVLPAGKAEADECSPAGKTANVAEAEKSIKTGKVAESSPSDGATKGIEDQATGVASFGPVLRSISFVNTSTSSMYGSFKLNFTVSFNICQIVSLNTENSTVKFCLSQNKENSELKQELHDL